jgi:hypothetical protein
MSVEVYSEKSEPTLLLLPHIDRDRHSHENKNIHLTCLNIAILHAMLFPKAAWLSFHWE